MTFTSSNLMVISPNRGPDEKGIVTKSGAGRPTSGPGPNRGPDEKGIVTLVLPLEPKLHTNVRIEAPTKRGL